MSERKRLLTGYISKPHGTGGRLTVRLNGDFAEKFVEEEHIFIEINENMVPFFIKEVEKFADRVILKLDFVDSVERAAQFTGSKVYLDIPDGIDDNTSIADLIGYELKDENSGISGNITDVVDTPMNPLFLVRNKETEFYIPLHPDLIVSINHKKKSIVMKLPDGFNSI